MKTKDALVIVLRAAEQNANGHEHAAEILHAVHIMDTEVLKRARCDHKFVDSRHCLKCGWEPE